MLESAPHQIACWPFSVFVGGFKKINKNKIYDDLVKKLNNENKFILLYNIL